MSGSNQFKPQSSRLIKATRPSISSDEVSDESLLQQQPQARVAIMPYSDNADFASPTLYSRPTSIVSITPSNSTSNYPTPYPPTNNLRNLLSPVSPAFQRHSGGSMSSTSYAAAYKDALAEGDGADDDSESDWKEEGKKGKTGTIFTARGLMNIGMLILLVCLLMFIFMGYPVYGALMALQRQNLASSNPNPDPFLLLGGINSTDPFPNGSAQGPWMTNARSKAIDPDTPLASHSKFGIEDPTEAYQLVFSDEFETEGRSFYPGDDPYWEAVDLHYWQTENLEWYSPRRVSTKGGYLVLELGKYGDLTHNGGLEYEGGMITSWNKMCFQGGYIETSVILPGRPDIHGLWPAIWTLGNLGRAGYGATLEGLWPYSYDSCDVGTAPNQTFNSLPAYSLTGGVQDIDGVTPGALSFSPGQRLSACTCKKVKDDGSVHPGPRRTDGTWVGRAAPEIDVFEAQVSDELIGGCSLSAQWAPFNRNYTWIHNANTFTNLDPVNVVENNYRGGHYQQASTFVATNDQQAYEHTGKKTSIYGFEYKPGDAGYIAWVANNKHAWTLKAGALAADATTKISARLISNEPMYIIANLGISNAFGVVEFEKLAPLFPVKMLVDYIRVYQPANQEPRIGCDPPDMPTSRYIAAHAAAYNNPNLTTWAQHGEVFPPNSFLGQC